MELNRCKYCETDTVHQKNDYYIRQENNDDFLLMFFKTPFIYKRGSKKVKAEKNHYLINPPFSAAEHGSYLQGFVNDWIFFSGKEAEKIIKQFKLPLNKHFYISENSLIYRYIEKIAAEQKFKQTCYENKISATINDMLIHLGREYEYSTKNIHPAFEAINSARNLMMNNIEKNITIKQLSEYASYSESRFCVLYNNFFASSPIDDLLNARIEKAASLLKYSNKSVTEIAGECGFSSLHYFSRKFKEKTGLSPSAYSNCHKI